MSGPESWKEKTERLEADHQRVLELLVSCRGLSEHRRREIERLRKALEYASAMAAAANRQNFECGMPTDGRFEEMQDLIHAVLKETSP